MSDALGRLTQLMQMQGMMENQKYKQFLIENAKTAAALNQQKFSAEQAELGRNQQLAQIYQNALQIPEGAPRDQYGNVDPRFIQSLLTNARARVLGSGIAGGIDAFKDTSSGVDEPWEQPDVYERVLDLKDRKVGIRRDGGQDEWKVGTSPTSLQYGQNARLREEAKLRKEFRSSPQWQSNYLTNVQVSRADAAMKKLSEDPQNMIATDQTLIMVMNKMLDEDSVVRESEYARTPENLSFINRMKGKYGKLKEGGAGLTDEDRRALYDMIQDFRTISQRDFEMTQSYYTDVAQQYGFNPYRVTAVDPEYKFKVPKGEVPPTVDETMEIQDRINAAFGGGSN